VRGECVNTASARQTLNAIWSPPHGSKTIKRNPYSHL